MEITKYKLSGVSFTQDDDKLTCTVDQGGVSCTYPIEPIKRVTPCKYLLMDLDGTTVKSEEFWISLIEKTAKSLQSDENFHLEEADTPFVSGFSTIAHLDYCLKKYNIPADISTANERYHQIAEFELNEILEGRGNIDAFHPREGLKEFLYAVKAKGIKIGLVTSGLEYKAIPEIVATFKLLDMGDPLEFYDAIVTGGKRKIAGQYGTVGELAVKPHPWVYAEMAVGMGIQNKAEALVLEDSSAGVISARTAGYPVIGFNDGNLLQSGLYDLCDTMIDGFDDLNL